MSKRKKSDAQLDAEATAWLKAAESRNDPNFADDSKATLTNVSTIANGIRLIRYQWDQRNGPHWLMLPERPNNNAEHQKINRALTIFEAPVINCAEEDKHGALPESSKGYRSAPVSSFAQNDVTFAKVHRNKPKVCPSCIADARKLGYKGWRQLGPNGPIAPCLDCNKGGRNFPKG